MKHIRAGQVITQEGRTQGWEVMDLEQRQHGEKQNKIQEAQDRNWQNKRGTLSWGDVTDMNWWKMYSDTLLQYITRSLVIRQSQFYVSI